MAAHYYINNMLITNKYNRNYSCASRFIYYSSHVGFHVDLDYKTVDAEC